MASHIPDDPRDLRCIGCRQVELTLRPTRDEGVKVRRVPLGGVPAEGEEELGMHLVWLEVSDVQDPQVGGIASDGRRQLIVGLSTEG